MLISCRLSAHLTTLSDNWTSCMHYTGT